MGWMIWGSSTGRGWEFFSSLPCPDRVWGSHSLLSSEYQGLFTWGQSDWNVKLTTHFHLVQNSWSYTPFLNTPSWRGAQLKNRSTFTFTFYLNMSLLYREKQF